MLPEFEEEGKSTNMSVGVTTIGQFEDTPEEGHHRLHPDFATLSEQNEGASSSIITQQGQCRKEHSCVSPKAQPQHTPNNSRQKQSVTTPTTKLDLQSRDKSFS